MTPTTAPTDEAVVPAADEAEAPEAVAAERLVAADLLVEDVSIDGMCGVY
jgi:mycofactocin precursor